jgi:hypothetical protein
MFFTTFFLGFLNGGIVVGWEIPRPGQLFLFVDRHFLL